MKNPTNDVIWVRERAPDGSWAGALLTLPYEMRCRSRLRAHLDDGREVGLVLPRGETLRDGDRLRAEDGTVIAVRAAPETCSVVVARDPWQLARACYHLGNRHVALQIGPGWLRFPHDHVLDAMVRALGLACRTEEVPFEPEGGAYPGVAAAPHAHGPASGPTNGHDHGHTHGRTQLHAVPSR